MKTRLAFGAAIVLLLPFLACDSDSTKPKTYPVTFVCEPTAGTACPPGTECPALPLGADTCGDLPGLFGHPCTCTTIVSSPSSPTPEWTCPI